MAGDLQLKVSVDASGAVKGLKVTADSVEAAGALMRQGLRNAGGGAVDAGKHFDSFLSTLKDFKSEQVQQARTARFFAGELASIVPGAEGARGALQSLIAVGLEGFGIGAAMEAAKFVLEQLSAVVTENETRAKNLRHAYQETGDSIRASLEGVRRSLEPISATQKAWLADQDKVREANRKTATEAKDYYESFAATLRDVASVWSFGAIDSSTKKIAEQMEVAAARTRALKNAESAKDATQAQEDVKTHEKFLRAQVTLEASTKDEIAKIRARLKVEIDALGEEVFASDVDRQNRRVALEAQAAAEIAKLRSQRDLELATTRLAQDKIFATARGAIWLDEAEAELKIREKYRLRQSADDQKAMAAELNLAKLHANHREDVEIRQYWDARLKAEASGQEALRAFGQRLDDDRLAEWMKVEAKMERQAQQLVSGAAQLGDAFGAAFADIATGAKSASDAFAAAGKAIFQSVIDTVVKAVEAYAVQAEAAAMANNGGVPIIGPLLAMAAAATMGGMVKGLLGNLPSAAGGWKVPTDTVAMVHAGEHILPREIAQNYEGGDGGPGGGVTIHINGPVFDGGLRALARHPDFIRGMRDAARMGG